MPSQLSGSHMNSEVAYSQYQAPNIRLEGSSGGIDSLSEDFGRVGLQSSASLPQKDIGDKSMESKEFIMGMQPSSKANTQMLYQLENGTLVYSGSPRYSYQQHGNSHLAVPFAAQYQQMGYGNMSQATNFNGITTPHGNGWISAQAMPPVPELIDHRRNSWSSNEEASPHTPMFSHWHGPPYLPHRSPSIWSTPSPMSGNMPHFHHFARDPSNGNAVIADFWAWTHQDPVIPAPVPARHSGPDGGRGSLDKILDNPDGTTNVYIRGLQPHTTDELLGLYGQRFGEIDTQKAIIDHATGTCKGFGFIKYFNFIHAENCIRAFYHLGYEAKFARESHNSRLKALADMTNTNLYISNLPKLINEDGLKAIFASVYPMETFPQFRAGSCKILKDSCGISRGVGFARFETPEICDQIINTFNNKVIGDGDNETTLQVRYADTQKQKELKSQTAIKRQFKADEYNEAVYGIPFPTPPAISPTFHTPVNGTVHINGSWIQPSPASSVSPTYVGYPNSVLRNRRVPSNPTGMIPGRVPQSSRINIESPSVLAAAKKAAVDAAEDSTTDRGSSIRSDGVQVSANSTTASTFLGDHGGSPTELKQKL